MCDSGYKSSESLNGTPDDETVYGGLFVIGQNKNRGRKKFIFKRRLQPNGVKKGNSSIFKTSQISKAMQDSKAFSISHTFAKDKTIVVQYDHDEETDMFQVGRASDEAIDFVVLDKYSGEIGKSQQSNVSKYAFRIIAERSNPTNVRLLAAGFDSSRNMFLGVKAIKWIKDNNIDGLTSNGVILSKPKGKFCGGNVEQGVWREVSVNGCILSVRNPRSSQEKGCEKVNETNVLKDGSLIDVCGVTLLWRTCEGLKHSPTKEYIKGLINNSSSGDEDPKNILVLPKKDTNDDSDFDSKPQPYVFINCGHVHGGLPQPSFCSICQTTGPTKKLCMGMEPAFYVDDIAETTSSPNLCAFNECGHIATEKTIKYWSKTSLPHGKSGLRAVCPFCRTVVEENPGYVFLKFNNQVNEIAK